MACYHPIPATQNQRGGPVTLGPPLGTATLALACGKCLGCRTDHATAWARRCTHEAQLHQHNLFITITYDDEHLPEEGHLRADHLRNYLKRLRKNTGQKFRYFACGEYGSTTNRPHYHAATFGLEIRDGKRAGKDLYESQQLTEIWGNGLVKFAPFTPATAAYIAQYQLKKQRGGREDADADGVWRPAPFLRMSLRPAIGRQWAEKYAEDLTHGYLITDGQKGPIPRYYKNIVKENRPDIYEIMEHKIQQKNIMNPTDKNTPERLAATELIHTQAKKHAERDLKNP